MEDLTKIYKYALESYYKLKNIVETFNGTLEELCDKLKGHNLKYDLFDVNFEYICGTIIKKDNSFLLTNSIEIWNDSTYEFIGTFDVKWLEKKLNKTL